MGNRMRLNANDVFGSHGYFPEDVLMKIMALLPVNSLLLFRTVSKRWNTILMDPQFHSIRRSLGQELVAEVQSRPELSDCILKCSAKDVLLMLHGAYDIIIVQPTKVSVRKLPRLPCTLDICSSDVLDLFVVDLLVDERTKEYTIFALSKVYPFRRRVCFVKSMVRFNLYCYSSVMDTWSLWGIDGLNLNARTLLRVTMHRDCYVALVQFKTITEDLYEHYRKQFYTAVSYNKSRWEALPGAFTPDLSTSTVADCSVDWSFFDHRGKLCVAAASYTSCLLWEYVYDTSGWVLLRDFSNLFHIETDRGLGNCAFVRWPYARCFKDYLHFGVYSSDKWWIEPCCRRMTYNLVTGKLEDMYYGQAQVVVVGHPRLNLSQTMLLQFG